MTFQLAEVAVTRRSFAVIRDRIARLAMPPPAVVGRMPAQDFIVVAGNDESLGDALRPKAAEARQKALEATILA